MYIRGYQDSDFFPDQLQTFIPVYERIFEYIRIFEYFPLNIDIHIQFVVILNAKYYSNILSEYWSLKIRGNAGIKEVLFSFFT